MYIKLLDDKCSRTKAKKCMRESEGPFLLVNLKESFLDFLKLGVKKLWLLHQVEVNVVYSIIVVFRFSV